MEPNGQNASIGIGRSSVALQFVHVIIPSTRNAVSQSTDVVC